MGLLRDLASAAQTGGQDVVTAVTGGGGSSAPAPPPPPTGAAPDPAGPVITLLGQLLDTVSGGLNNAAQNPVTPAGPAGAVPLPYLNFGPAKKPDDKQSEPTFEAIAAIVVLVQLTGTSTDPVWFHESAKRLQAALPRKISESLADLSKHLQVQQFKMRSRGPAVLAHPRRLQALLPILERCEKLLGSARVSKGGSGDSSLSEIGRLLGAIHTTKTAFRRKVIANRGSRG